MPERVPAPGQGERIPARTRRGIATRGISDFRRPRSTGLQSHGESPRGEAAGTPFTLLGADREAQLFARAALWEARLGEIAEAFGLNLDQLPVTKSTPEKLALAAVMKATTSVTNRWIAERLQMGAVSSVGPLLLQFRLHDSSQTPRFKRVLSRFMT